MAAKITRADALFTIGYDGSTALVDRAARAQFGSLGTRELAERGLYRAAAAAAIRSGDPAELSLVADAYNRASGGSYRPDALPRLFGVGEVVAQRVLAL